MDTPSESSFSWGPIISSALARTVLVLVYGSAIARISKPSHLMTILAAALRDETKS